MKFLLFTITLFTIGHFASAQDIISDTADLDKAIQLINNSLIEAKASLADITLKTAKVTLNTIYDKSGGGGIKLFVKASKNWQSELSSTITYSFSIPKLDKSNIASSKNDLTKIIVQAANQYKASKQTITGLNKDGFDTELSFFIKKNSSLGLGLEIGIFNIDLSGATDTTVAHTLSLSFK